MAEPEVKRGRPDWDTSPRKESGQFGRKKEVIALTPANVTGRPQINQSKNNPWQKQFTQYNDFQSYFLPTDDIYASSGSGDDTLPALAHFQFLAEQRIGVPWKIARKPAEDAVRNEFTIRDRSGEEVIDDKLFDWLHDPVVDFYNQLMLALYFERVYGTGFLMTYFTDSDKDNEDFSEPAPKGKRPVSYQAFPPTVMTPINVYKTTWLGSNPQKWDLNGGTYNTSRIDHTRVHVIMTRPSANRWRGLSVFEPIWIPLMSYFQAQIYMLRAFSEMGNVIPAWIVDSEDDQYEIINKYADLLDEMKMNGKYVGKKGDEFIFQNTNIGAGLENLMEMWKEDISAGSNIPMPILFGRVTAAGMSGAAYLMAERYYWNEISNIQHSLSDDVIRIINAAGFKSIDYKKRVDWQLAITKTDQQRLLDEGMQIQNEMLKEDLLQKQLQTAMMMDQYNAQKQNPQKGQNNSNQGQSNGSSDQEDASGNGLASYTCSKCNKMHYKGSKIFEEHRKYATGIGNKERDFVIEKILEERTKINNEYMWGARKVA